ncbi:hypothetical protein [Psychroserpens luteolus]|uniref:hypothetical protein n=1 Tax=Psychroserpens luteolus TaxID=2855840 RepID=UPI001E338492|nr:hypothetical protein [Psychroserpens luteolus]MCD2259003.1 hypothetical protein [Psychroserpens luteolus]
MKYSFKLKKSQLKSVFSNKMGFKSLTIQNKNDVQNAINTVLMFIELEDKLVPINFSYNFLNNSITFELTYQSSSDKKLFFDSIRKFENYITG